MIGSLRGSVLERNVDGTVVIEVGGVGYIVHVSPRSIGEFEPTTDTFVYVHHHIREDAQQLYGFLTRDERTTFQILIKSNGVGPALAMAIISTHPPAVLVDIVANGDVGALTLVPGVGKKTAEKMMVDLKSRLNVPMLSGDAATSGSSVISDVREALLGLGYGENEIRDTLRDLPASGDAATLLRDALKSLGARRA